MNRLNQYQLDLLKYINLVEGLTLGQINRHYVDIQGNPPFDPSLLTDINNTEKRSLSNSLNSFRKGSDRSQYKPLPQTWKLYPYYSPIIPGVNIAPEFNNRLYQSQFEATMSRETRSRSKKSKTVKFTTVNPPTTGRGRIRVPNPIAPTTRTDARVDAAAADTEARTNAPPIATPDDQAPDPNWSAFSYNVNIPGVPGLIDVTWTPTPNEHGHACSGPSQLLTTLDFVAKGASDGIGGPVHNTLIIQIVLLSLEMIGLHNVTNTIISPCGNWIIFEFPFPIHLLSLAYAQTHKQMKEMRRLGKEKYANNRKDHFESSLSTIYGGPQTYRYAIYLCNLDVNLQELQGNDIELENEVSTESILTSGKVPCDVTGRPTKQTVPGVACILSIGKAHGRVPTLKPSRLEHERSQQDAKAKAQRANARRIMGGESDESEEEEEEEEEEDDGHFNLSGSENGSSHGDDSVVSDLSAFSKMSISHRSKKVKKKNDHPSKSKKTKQLLSSPSKKQQHQHKKRNQLNSSPASPRKGGNKLPSPRNLLDKLQRKKSAAKDPITIDDDDEEEEPPEEPAATDDAEQQYVESILVFADIEENDGGGLCGWMALAQIFFGHQKFWRRVKNIIYRELAKHKDYYYSRYGRDVVDHYLAETFDEYLDDFMGNDNIQMNHLELTAGSYAFSTFFTVYDSATGSDPIMIPDDENEQQKCQKQAFLLRTGGSSGQGHWRRLQLLPEYVQEDGNVNGDEADDEDYHGDDDESKKPGLSIDTSDQNGSTGDEAPSSLSGRVASALASAFGMGMGNTPAKQQSPPEEESPPKEESAPKEESPAKKTEPVPTVSDTAPPSTAKNSKSSASSIDTTPQSNTTHSRKSSSSQTTPSRRKSSNPATPLRTPPPPKTIGSRTKSSAKSQRSRSSRSAAAPSPAPPAPQRQRSRRTTKKPQQYSDSEYTKK